MVGKDPGELYVYYDSVAAAAGDKGQKGDDHKKESKVLQVLWYNRCSGVAGPIVLKDKKGDTGAGVQQVPWQLDPKAQLVPSTSENDGDKGQKGELVPR